MLTGEAGPVAGVFTTTVAAATAAVSTEGVVVPLGILVAGIGVSAALAWRASQRWITLERDVAEHKRSLDRMRQSVDRLAEAVERIRNGRES